jgi:major membrane immunogen (membrane-anchored lipoprotein)
MRSRWIIAGCVVAGSLVVGCERNDHTANRGGSSGSGTSTYGNANDRSSGTVTLDKTQIMSECESQLTQTSDEMHRWMETASKEVIAGGDTKVANDFRDARDAMEKAADKARKQLQDLKTSDSDSAISRNRKQFDDALADLRKQIDQGKNRFANSGNKASTLNKSDNAASPSTTSPSTAPSVTPNSSGTPDNQANPNATSPKVDVNNPNNNAGSNTPGANSNPQSSPTPSDQPGTPNK